MIKFLLLPVLLLAALLLPSPARAACTDLPTLPATISASGNYCLSANHTVNLTTGAAITIAASNVPLDCQDHTVNNTATTSTATSSGIYATGRHDLNVRNCRITGGFGYGIQIHQNNAAANQNYYINLQDNFIGGPYWHGILAYGSAIELRGNRVYDVGGRSASYAMGIRVGASTVAGQPRFFVLRDNLVAGTNAPANVAYGIYGENTVAGIFIANGVTGSSGASTYSFRIGGSVNRLTENHIIGSGKTTDYGIYTVSATDACYDNHIRATTPTVGCDAELGNY